MHTVKDHLARLLATEDLVVEHRQVDTAAFDVERRVLTLPVWDKAESVVIDLLISHEVGHALYTPNDWSFEGQVPMQFVNIVEDIRIEKLMKRRYAGLAKTFYKGYSILSDKDFFGIGDDDISTFNLADKLICTSRSVTISTFLLTKKRKSLLSVLIDWKPLMRLLPLRRSCMTSAPRR